jgi:hypothetical protein
MRSFLLCQQAETGQQYEISRLYEWGRRAFVPPAPDLATPQKKNQTWKEIGVCHILMQNITIIFKNMYSILATLGQCSVEPWGSTRKIHYSISDVQRRLIGHLLTRDVKTQNRAQ